MPGATSSRFRFGGRLSLDLTWTLARRHWAPVELLTSDEDVATWISLATKSGPIRMSIGALEEARQLREAIYRCVHRRIQGQRLPSADVDVINRWAQHPPAYPVLTTAGTVRTVSDEPVRAGLGAIARDAVEVLSAPGDRLRECGRDGCGGLYFDSSPAGRRRWCLADRCGNAVNTARYRERRTPPRES